MLLIRDHERELIIDDLLLKQGMGADDEVRIVGGDARIERFPLLRRHRPRHEHRSKWERMLLDHRLHLRIVLLRENLRRRHHTSLAMVIDRQQHGEQSDQSLPASHISLQKAVHRYPACHLTYTFADGTVLRSRKSERQKTFKFVGIILCDGNRCCFFPVTLQLH